MDFNLYNLNPVVSVIHIQASIIYQNNWFKSVSFQLYTIFNLYISIMLCECFTFKQYII